MAAQPSITPLGKQILIQRSAAASTSAGGLILPESAQEKPQQGSVLALGAGKLNDDGSRAAFQVSVGDVVIFNSYAGTEVSHGGEDFLLMAETDILAIVA